MLDGPGGLLRATGRSLAPVEAAVQSAWRSWSEQRR
jgi:ABC-type protease/lipase transport system fused ATPase/permease subunit